MQNEELRKAIDLIKNNQKQEGEKLLKSLIQNNPNIELAWLWLASCKNEDKEKVYCLEQALRINPQNEKVRQIVSTLNNRITKVGIREPKVDENNVYRQDQLEETPKQAHISVNSTLNTPLIPKKPTKSVEFIPAVCPNCGGELRVPDNLEKAICLYCGLSFLIRDQVVNSERNIKNYTDLLTIAIENSNFSEAYQYSNKILEIDSKNQFAWICKGYAHGAIAIEQHFEDEPDWGGLLEESRKYILKGLTINLPDEDVTSTTYFKNIRENTDQGLRFVAAKYCLKIRFTALPKKRNTSISSQSVITDRDYIDFVSDILERRRYEDEVTGYRLAYEGLAYLLLKDNESVQTFKNGANIDKQFIEKLIIDRLIDWKQTQRTIIHQYDNEVGYLKGGIQPSLTFYELTNPPWFWFYKELWESNQKIKNILDNYYDFSSD